MFSAAPPDTLNHLGRLRPHERRGLHRRGLAQAAEDDQQTQGLLAQFTALWGRARQALDDLVALPARLQQARADLERVRLRAIARGLPDVAQEAERLFGEVQAREGDVGQVAALIQQWRGTWEQIEGWVTGTLGTITGAIGGFFQTLKRAVGLGVLPFLPLAGLIAAVAALGFVTVTGLAVLAWWQTTAATIEGVKQRVLPTEALTGRGFLQGVSTPLLIGVGSLVGLSVLMTALSSPPRRR